MAYVVDEWPEPEPVERIKHPWPTYFDGRVHVLEYPKDWKSLDGTRSSAYAQARRDGLPSPRVAWRGNLLYVQMPQAENGEGSD